MTCIVNKVYRKEGQFKYHCFVNTLNDSWRKIWIFEYTENFVGLLVDKTISILFITQEFISIDASQHNIYAVEALVDLPIFM